MANYVYNYVAIHGEEQAVADLKAKCFIWPDWLSHPEDEGRIFQLDLDQLFPNPMPEELRKTGAPTKVYETQEEVDEANLKYLDFQFRGDQEIIAITREEAQRRTQKYGHIFGDSSEYSENVYGILNGHEWLIANRSSRWNRLNLRVIHESPGLLAFRMESAWLPPYDVYDRLVELGFKVAWEWDGDFTDEIGHIGDYSGFWSRRQVWDFQPDAEWMTGQEKRDRYKQQQEETARTREREQRMRWANWFRENKGAWASFFPNHDMEEYFRRKEEEAELQESDS